MNGSRADAPAGARAFFALCVAVAAISTAAIGIREAGAWSPAWIGAGRVATTALLLAPFAAPELRALWALMRRQARVRRVVLGASIFLAAHFATWITSLSMTSVVTSVALVATQPLFAAFLGRWLGDRVPLRAYLGAGVAVVGGVIISGELGTFGGAALALAGAGCGAAYLAAGRSVRAEVPLSGYFVTVHAGAAMLLVAFALLRGDPWPSFTSDAWIYVLYLGCVPGVVGHGLMNWAVRRVPLHLVALMILAEPIGSGVLAWLWLGEVPRTGEILGGVVILVGIAVGAWPAREPASAR